MRKNISLRKQNPAQGFENVKCFRNCTHEKNIKQEDKVLSPNTSSRYVCPTNGTNSFSK